MKIENKEVLENQVIQVLAENNLNLKQNLDAARNTIAQQNRIILSLRDTIAGQESELRDFRSKLFEKVKKHESLLNAKFYKRLKSLKLRYQKKGKKNAKR